MRTEMLRQRTDVTCQTSLKEYFQSHWASQFFHGNADISSRYRKNRAHFDADEDI